jgi:hypothetical protein
MTGYFEFLTRTTAGTQTRTAMGRTWTHTRSAEAVLVRMLLSFQRPPCLHSGGTLRKKAGRGHT